MQTAQECFGIPGRLKPSRSEALLVGNQGHASTNTAILYFTGVNYQTGNAFNISNSSVTGLAITIKEAGLYHCSMTLDLDASYGVGITVNSTQLTTSILSIPASQVKVNTQLTAAGVLNHCGAVFYCNPGDIIRPHTSSTSALSSSLTAVNRFLITKVSE